MSAGNLDKKFEEYHAANPHVFDSFRKAAYKLKAAGREHFGAKCIMEYIRFQTAVSGADFDGFKINNNFTSRYVRLLEHEDPEFIGFFQKRAICSRHQGELF